MLFRPKDTKFTKQRKGRKFNRVSTDVDLHSVYKPLEIAILRAMNHARITETQLLAIKQTLAKKLKKKGKFSIKLLTDVPVSKKPLEIRMGKGKGAVDRWIAKIVPGMPIIEMRDMSMLRATRLLKIIQKKLPIETSIDVS
jgi:large subunit ribosomal protein L16